MANTLLACPQLTKIPAFNNPLINLYRFDTTESATITADGETYYKKGYIENATSSQWVYAKLLVDKYLEEHRVNGIMTLSELATELGITITTDLYNTTTGKFEVNINRALDLYCTFGYVVFTDAGIEIRSPIQRGSAVNITATGTTTELSYNSKETSLTLHSISNIETLKPYNEAVSANIREMIDGVRKSYEDMIYVKSTDTTGIAGDYFVIDAINYIIMDKRIEGLEAYYTCVKEITAGTAVDSITTAIEVPYKEIFIPDVLPNITMESTGTVIRVNAGSNFKMNSSGLTYFIRENANNDTSVGSVSAATYYYFYCTGVLGTGTFDLKKGVYSISTNAPTYNYEKNGWYYGENICIAKLYALTTSTMDIIFIYNHKSSYEKINEDYKLYEINTGKKWIDGKHIYRKVIIDTCATATATNKYITFNKSTLGIDFIIKYWGIADFLYSDIISEHNIISAFPWADITCAIWFDNNNNRFGETHYRNEYNSQTLRIIVEYTKS